MKKGNGKKEWSRKYWHPSAGICGLLFLLQGRAASADLIVEEGMKYSNAPGSPWMETAVIIVGLMVILAVGAILYLRYRKKQEEEERMQREEAEREES